MKKYPHIGGPDIHQVKVRLVHKDIIRYAPKSPFGFFEPTNGILCKDVTHDFWHSIVSEPLEGNQ